MLRKEVQKPSYTPLSVVCDICRIRMSTRTTRSRLDQFIQDHHVCDPKVGVRVVSLKTAARAIWYTDVKGDFE